MSFILEALKKSDQKRQEGEVPRLETVHRSSSQSRSGQAKWIWVLLVLLVLILNAGVLLWIFGPWQQERKVTAGVQKTRPPLRQPTVASSTPEKIQVEAAPAPVKLPEPVPLEEEGPRSAAPVVLEEPQKTGKQVAKVVSPEVEPEKRLYSLNELPATVKRSIPEMHMSLHAFNRSSSSASLVRINNQILREGARLTDRCLLEKITAEGAILSFEGYRFLLPRKGHTE